MAAVAESSTSSGTQPAPRRRVLFHSYHFPPIGGAGSQRPARFVRLLPELGYDPVVVTGPGPNDDRYAPADDSLGTEIPTEIPVNRVAMPEPASSEGWRARRERLLRRRSPWARWWSEQSYAVGRAAARPGVDLVYAWMQPYASAEPAARLARELGVPWVADLGDPWALDEMMVYPSALHRALERRQMQRSLASADAIVMSTPEAVARLLQAFPNLAARPVVAIPNGYDAEDFASPVTARSGEAFRIVHTGYLLTELGLRHRASQRFRRVLGGSVPVDILTRSHVFLLEAIRALLGRRPDLAAVIEVHLVGVMSEADLAAIGSSPFVRVHGFVPHDQTVRQMREADLLFLPMQDLPPGVRAGLVPGKTYEYLAAGRPILAAVPDGDARDILSEAGGVILCRPADVDGMSAAIERQVDLWREGMPAELPDASVVRRFEYQRLVRNLADVFEAVCLARSTP